MQTLADARRQPERDGKPAEVDLLKPGLCALETVKIHTAPQEHIISAGPGERKTCRLSGVTIDRLLLQKSTLTTGSVWPDIGIFQFLFEVEAYQSNAIVLDGENKIVMRPLGYNSRIFQTFDWRL